MSVRAAAAVAASLALAACGSPNGDAAGGGSGSAKSAPLSPVEQGRRAFRECAVCHLVAAPGTKDAEMKLIGPNLHGVVGRKAGSLPDFAYSKAMRESDVVWNDATLDAYIAQPAKTIPGNRMSFVGEPDAEKRAAIIAYLKDNSPAP